MGEQAPAAYRIGTFGRLTGTTFFFLPMVWLGFPVRVVLATLTLNLLYQFWIHATWIPRLGWHSGLGGVRPAAPGIRAILRSGIAIGRAQAQHAIAQYSAAPDQRRNVASGQRHESRRNLIS